MSWRTSKLLLLARNIGRRMGINKRLAVLLNGAGYEARYDQALITALRAGDCVWDVGANVGYYTRQFAEKVGEGGLVYGFEPSPHNFGRLQAATSSVGNVRLVNAGLGSEGGKLLLLQGADELGATSRIVGAGEGGVSIEIHRGMDLISAGQAVQPNAMKIDVEGFELEVLQGMAGSLSSKSLRVIGVEVHFSILKARGLEEAPQQIEQLLQRHGLTVTWPDASHIVALRANS